MSKETYTEMNADVRRITGYTADEIAEQGAEEERARIVAWLRDTCPQSPDYVDCLGLADAIERGDHNQPELPGTDELPSDHHFTSWLLSFGDTPRSPRSLAQLWESRTKP